MSQCRIHLENYSANYYPGSEIKGRLECYFNDDTKIRGIKLRLICKEKNEWSGTESYTDPSDNQVKTRYITLVGDHDILSFEQMLFGSNSGTQVVPRGRHVYPFFYTLSHDIPSSFNGPHGSVSYTLHAIVDIPMWTDYTDSLHFIVISPIDFNRAYKQLQEATTYSDEKTVCCWCCKGGDVSMDVELPKLAYVAGEVINLKVAITNLSNSNVESLRVKLTKTITYKVTSPHSESKEDVESIVSLTDHGVGAHGEHTFNLQLAIPTHIQVPNFTGCNLFDVSYLLQVFCAMPACTLDLEISVWNIKIGHIQYVEHNATNGGGETRTITPGFTSFNNLPPIDGTYPPTAPINPGNLYQGSSQPPYPMPPMLPGFSNLVNAPPKAAEAAASAPSAPYEPGPELPPPSYEQVQQGAHLAYANN